SLWWLLDGPARSHDLLLGRTRDLVDRDRELHGDVTVSENLDLLVLANGTLGDEVTDRDVTALGVQLGELLQVHDLVLDAERVLEAAELRGAHVQRHLPALEPDAHRVACPGALGTATGSLALGALTATDTSLRGVGAGDRTQVVDLEHAWARHGCLSLGSGSLLGGRLLGSGLLRGSVSLGVGSGGRNRRLLRSGLLLGSCLGSSGLLRRGLLRGLCLDGVVLLSH